MHQVRRAGLILWELLVLAGCADVGDDGGAPMNGGDADENISIVSGATFLCDQAYDPNSLTIPVGTIVVWRNKDNVKHTVTSSDGFGCSPNNALPDVDRDLKSTELEPEQIDPERSAYFYIFNFPGIYDYVCTIVGHQMRGRVIVVE